MLRWQFVYQGGNMWASFPAWAEACLNILKLDKLDCWKKYKAWEDCAKLGGFRVMHEKFCIVSDFPENNETKRIGNRYILHCETGPAQRWRDGFETYYLNGIKVSKEIVMTPSKKLDVNLIIKEKNVEIRREIIRKIGIDLVCQRLGAKVIDKQGTYELVNPNIGDDRYRPYLKMKNPSIGVWHLEGVSPDCRTVADALEWRNGTKEKPIVLT